MKNLTLDQVLANVERNKFRLKMRDAEFSARNTVFIVTMGAVDRANQRLNAKLNGLRHLCNDQLIELKYGKGYKANFMDEILIQANSL